MSLSFFWGSHSRLIDDAIISNLFENFRKQVLPICIFYAEFKDLRTRMYAGTQQHLQKLNTFFGIVSKQGDNIWQYMTFLSEMIRSMNLNRVWHQHLESSYHPIGHFPASKAPYQITEAVKAPYSWNLDWIRSLAAKGSFSDTTSRQTRAILLRLYGLGWTCEI